MMEMIESLLNNSIAVSIASGVSGLVFGKVICWLFSSTSYSAEAQNLLARLDRIDDWTGDNHYISSLSVAHLGISLYENSIHVDHTNVNDCLTRREKKAILAAAWKVAKTLEQKAKSVKTSAFREALSKI